MARGPPGSAAPIGLWQCDDRAAVRAVGRFLDDHRSLVEPSCGAAALAPVYERAPGLFGRAVVVVCGGAAVTRAALRAWEQEPAAAPRTD